MKGNYRMTHGDILFLLIFAPLAVLAIVRSARGDGVEIPSGRQLTALSIGAVVLAGLSFVGCWWWEHGWEFWSVIDNEF